jgi:hypothetical protein
MKLPALIFTSLLICTACATAQAQTTTTAQERAQTLRTQLQEVQAKEAELKLQLQQLETDMQPENIEHSLAGVGSTHPEDLRQQRRRQLEIEKAKVQAQLDQLGASHARLESDIARADGEAYRESAGQPVSSEQPSAAAGATNIVPSETGKRKTVTEKGRQRAIRHRKRERRQRRQKFNGGSG